MKEHVFEYDGHVGCAQCGIPKNSVIHTDSLLYETLVQVKELQAEHKRMAILIDQLRGDMSEETRAELYVNHIIPTAYGNDEYNMGGHQGAIAFIQYKKTEFDFPTIGNSWIEVAEKLATGWRPEPTDAVWVRVALSNPRAKDYPDTGWIAKEDWANNLASFKEVPVHFKNEVVKLHRIILVKAK